ncbi:hypothetical protein CGCA056_v002586 [Colletotrichum aenigma]|uniref:uncharacterized protein n=1 Tax=Colletotrichum aenigma TaxID=1215731 RepID=UPI0018733BA3|nr:uncharacterized protein CGCA056_v002586 [Colletotrichum aenigma]KAF5526441.1 hypothetical protein CGCA056_v002586 [Colletotrichum aenigma]
MRPALILSLFLGAVMAVDDVSRAPHAGPGAGHALLHEAFVYKREGKGKRASRNNQVQSLANVLIPHVSPAAAVIEILVGSPAPSSL